MVPPKKSKPAAKKGKDATPPENKMDEGTIKIFQKIIDSINTEITSGINKIFVKSGGHKEAVKRLEKKGIDAKKIRSFQLSDIDPTQLPDELGMDFRIIPSLLDSATNRPVAGTAYVMKVVRKINFDFSKDLIDIQMKMLEDAAKEFPENEQVQKALEASRKVLNSTAKPEDVKKEVEKAVKETEK